MPTPIEHINEMEEVIDKFSKDEHIKAADVFAVYEDLRLAMHDFRKVIEQDDNGTRKK